MTMADRIVIMKDGFVQQVGKPMELYDHPVNKFVAGFIGSPQMKRTGLFRFLGTSESGVREPCFESGSTPFLKEQEIPKDECKNHQNQDVQSDG